MGRLGLKWEGHAAASAPAFHLPWIGIRLARSGRPAGAAVIVRNPIALARPSETIVLQAAELRQLLAVDDVRKVHVHDQGSGQELLVQAVDTNDDGVFDQLLFQAGFAPRQTRTFLLSVGERQIPRLEDYKTYGRFVRERRDDFAWENDRIAHRMYGPELETFPRSRSPAAPSTSGASASASWSSITGTWSTTITATTERAATSIRLASPAAAAAPESGPAASSTHPPISGIPTSSQPAPSACCSNSPTTPGPPPASA